MARAKIGIGTVSSGWMGQLHTRAYRCLLDHYPECELEPRRYDGLKVTEAYDCLRPASIYEVVSAIRVIDAMDRSSDTGRWEGIEEPEPYGMPDPRATTGERRMGGNE